MGGGGNRFRSGHSHARSRNVNNDATNNIELHGLGMCLTTISHPFFLSRNYSPIIGEEREKMVIDVDMTTISTSLRIKGVEGIGSMYEVLSVKENV